MVRRKELSSMLAQLMDRAGLRVGDVARKLGVDQPVLSMWRSGKLIIPDDKLRILLDLCAEEGITATVDEVRARNGHPRPPVCVAEPHAPADLFVRILREQGKTLEEVAQSVGVKRQAVHRWKTKGPPLSRLSALAEALGVTEADLRGFDLVLVPDSEDPRKRTVLVPVDGVVPDPPKPPPSIAMKIRKKERRSA